MYLKSILLSAVISLVFVGISSKANALPNAFECEVLSAHVVSNDGKIVNDTNHLKEQVGTKFSVERNSGKIDGSYFIDNSSSEKITVINEPADNSYYVVSFSHEPYKMVGYLYIGNQFDTEKKPFTFTSSGQYIYSGFCL